MTERMRKVDAARRQLCAARAYMVRRKWYYCCVSADLAYHDMVKLGKELSGLKAKRCANGLADYESKEAKKSLESAIPYAIAWCEKEWARLVKEEGSNG